MQRATLFFLVAIVVIALTPATASRQVAFAADLNRVQLNANLVAQATSGFITWFYSPSPGTPWPSPIASANAGIQGAFAAGNVYDSGFGGFGPPPGLSMLLTGKCNFVCFGAPGSESHHVAAFGNDFTEGGDYVNPFTHFGAADDCQKGDHEHMCPGHIGNQALGFTLAPSPRPSYSDGFYLAVDYQGNLGVAHNVVAGAAVIAGAGNGAVDSAPYPSPRSGSLVSRTGSGQGDVLLGDSSASHVKCDYGETTSGSLTCDAPLWSAVSTSSSAGPVPPCYQSSGTSCSSTFHIVKNVSNLGIETAASCANNAWCALLHNVISLSSSAVFANNNYNCSLSSTSTIKLTLTVNAQSASSFTIQVYNNSGSAIGITSPLGINYVCSGN